MSMGLQLRNMFLRKHKSRKVGETEKLGGAR